MGLACGVPCWKKFRDDLTKGGLGLHEGSKRDSSAAQVDSFADEREEKNVDLLRSE